MTICTAGHAGSYILVLINPNFQADNFTLEMTAVQNTDHRIYCLSNIHYKKQYFSNTKPRVEGK